MSVTDPTRPALPAAADARLRPGLAGGGHLSLAARAGLLMAALFAEKSALNLLVDFRLADETHGFGTLLRLAQHYGLRFAVSFAVALAFFICVRADSALLQVNAEARGAPVRAAWLGLHCALMIAVAAALHGLYGDSDILHGGPRLPFALVVCAAVLLTFAAAAALFVALAPWRLWRRAAAATGMQWVYAACAAVIGTGAIVWSQELWAPTAQLTFALVRDVLSPVLPTLHADAATRILSTPTFAVEVSSICSGLEGVGLMLAFCSAWLLYFRAEYRFPRALLIVPAGVLLVFALNVLRIAALVLIGNSGHPAIAIYGFHSQAGWIGFNCVACAVAFVSRKSRWLNRAATRADGTATSNATAAYLLPFLAILAAGMISRASSSGFETWYALRLLVAVPALALWWRPLSGLDWRFGWRGIAVGAAVFALWLGAAHLLLAPHGMPATLAAMPAATRSVWIATRALTGILLVPIAEELAYRGYLMRRLLAEDFEAVPFTSVGWTTLLVTAVAFGVLHGALWLPAIAAGVAYGLVLTRTGRMGEAVAAHATTNLLLAVWVLAAGQWQLW